MRILDFIKSIFKRNKTKLLEETNENEQQVEKLNEVRNQFNESNKVNIEKLERSDKTKSEKVMLFLESVGCEKDTFKEIKDFENIDLQKMKDNLMLLTSIGLTKSEIDMAVRK